MKIYNSFQHATKNATKLLLPCFPMPHWFKQLKATGPSHEKSLCHAAQVDIFFVVLYCKWWKKFCVDVWCSASDTLRGLFICFACYTLIDTECMRTSKLFCRLGTGMVSHITETENCSGLYFYFVLWLLVLCVQGERWM